MLKLNDGSFVVDYKDFISNNFINYSFKKTNYDKHNPALRIYFKNDLKHNTRIFKQLIKLKNAGINFCTEINGKKIRYIISNYNTDEVLKGFEALYTSLNTASSSGSLL